MAGGEHRATREVEGRILRVIAGQRLQAAFGQSVDHTADARPVHGAGAHRTRLRRRIHRAAGEKARLVIPRRLRCEQPLRVRGHVPIGHESIFGFDQQLAVGANENRTERMISMRVRPPRHLECLAQERLMIERAPGRHR